MLRVGFHECSGTKSDIFRGVVIHVNGFTTPTAAELRQMMAEVRCCLRSILIFSLLRDSNLAPTIGQHGGRYETYPTSNVTHIILSNLPHAKIKQLKGCVDIRSTTKYGVAPSCNLEAYSATRG